MKLSNSSQIVSGKIITEIVFEFSPAANVIPAKKHQLKETPTELMHLNEIQRILKTTRGSHSHLIPLKCFHK